MRRIINGCVYDTNTKTTKCLWSDNNGLSSNDYNYSAVTMYITKDLEILVERERYSNSDSTLEIVGKEEALKIISENYLCKEEMDEVIKVFNLEVK